MGKPVRLRLSRAKGFDLQAQSRQVNGRVATSVARPSLWGNPYKVAPAFESGDCRIPEITAETAVALFRERWDSAIGHRPSAIEALDALRGRNLACWCPLDRPCHADVLLDLANRER